MRYKEGDVVYDSSKQEWVMIDDAWDQGYTGCKIPSFIDPMDMNSEPESSTQFIYEGQIDHDITSLLGGSLVEGIKTYIVGWNDHMTEISRIIRERKGE